MIEVGRLCVKLAGRDSGRTCVVVDVVDERTVLIDGDVRRRNCNLNHLEPLAEKVDLKKGASHADVTKAFEKLNLSSWSTKPKKAGERPRKVRKSAMKAAPEAAKVEEKPKPTPAEKKEAPAPKAEAKLAEKKEEQKAAPAKPAEAKPAEKKKVTDFGAEQK